MFNRQMIFLINSSEVVSAFQPPRPPERCLFGPFCGFWICLTSKTKSAFGMPPPLGFGRASASVQGTPRFWGGQTNRFMATNQKLDRSSEPFFQSRSRKAVVFCNGSSPGNPKKCSPRLMYPKDTNDTGKTSAASSISSS